MTHIEQSLADRLRQLGVPLPRFWRDGVSQETFEGLLYWAVKACRQHAPMTHGSSTSFGTQSPVSYRAAWGM